MKERAPFRLASLMAESSALANTTRRVGVIFEYFSCVLQAVFERHPVVHQHKVRRRLELLVDFHRLATVEGDPRDKIALESNYFGIEFDDLRIVVHHN
ncbi:MAG: hypothetical protein ABIH66_05380 [bacterium]